MLEFDNDPILNDPESWTPADLDLAKQTFRTQRPSVSADIVRAIWQYWSRHRPNELLFEDDVDNVAFLLHAKAYGESVSEGSFLGKHLEKHSELVAPLEHLSRLAWGPRAALAQEVLVGLDAPVMHAWIFLNGPLPQQILIVGEGLPEIRQQVLAAAFTTSLRVWGVASDMMNIGVLRVELPGFDGGLDVPYPLIGDHPHQLELDAAENAQAALDDLLSHLKKLEKENGLVQVHEVNLTERDSLIKALRGYAGQASAHSDRALLWHGKGEAAPTDLVTVIPYWRVLTNPLVLRLTLSADLLKTLNYLRLVTQYQYATIERSLQELHVRREYYQQEVKRLEEIQVTFNKASKEERHSIWGPNILVSAYFDHEIGVSIQLPQPEEVLTETFFETNVPALIRQHRDWENRMIRIIASVEQSSRRSDSPVRRFAASRFFDAATRQRQPDESQGAQAAFEIWRASIQPLVWFEWRCLLKGFGIKAEDVFTPHTFIHMGILAQQKQLVMTPYSVVDQHRSVVLFDSKRHVVVVRDATDYAMPSTGEPEADADLLWQTLEALVERRDVGNELFAEELRKALQRAPRQLMKRILEALLAHYYEGQTDVDLKVALGEAWRQAVVPRRMAQALAALNVDAFQSAREVLALEDIPEQWRVRVCLLRACVECIIAGEEIEEALPAIFRGFNIVAPDPIRLALDEARNADAEYATNWITTLPAANASKAIAQLRQGLPRARDTSQPIQYAALLARGATEAVRLARELEQAATTLKPEQETVVDAFVKLGLTLEDMLLAEYAGASKEEIFDLIAVVTGRRPPRYAHS